MSGKNGHLRATRYGRGAARAALATCVLLAGATVLDGAAVAAPLPNYLVLAGTGTGAGSVPAAAGSVATATALEAPSGVATDASGNVLLADRDNSLVELLARSPANPGYLLAGAWHAGELYVLAGDAAGSAPTGGSGTVGILTKLDLPGAVAGDPAGNVLIADTGDDEIELLAESATNPGYDLDGAPWTRGHLYVLAGGGHTAPSVAGSAATGVALDQPSGVTAGPNGEVLVSDTADNELELLAASVVNPGYPALPGSLIAGDLYVIAGGAAASAPDACGVAAESAALNYPAGLTLDGTGNVFLADSGNNEVELLAVSGQNPGYPLGAGASWRPGEDYVLAGSGAHASGSSCPLISPSALNDPTAVALDPSGDVLVADSDAQLVQVLAVTSSDPGYSISGSWQRGESYAVVGGGGALAGLSGTFASATALVDPEGVAVDAEGEVLVADAGTSEVGVLQLAPGSFAAPATASGDGEITLSWLPPMTDGGEPILGYQVVVSIPGGSAPVATFATGSSSTDYEVSGLVDATSYQFAVAAENAIGLGPLSLTALATPNAPATAGASSAAPTQSSAPSGPPPDASVLAASAAPATSPPATKKSAKKLAPAIRLATPSATLGPHAVVLVLSCNSSCKGVVEVTTRIAVGKGRTQVFETAVLAFCNYHLLTSTPRPVRAALTSIGQKTLAGLRRPLVVGETLTVAGGKTTSGRLRLLAPSPK